MTQKRSDFDAALAAGHAMTNLDTSSDEAVIIPEGYQLLDLEEYKAHPRRTAKTVRIKEAGDFVRYVQRFKTDDTTVYADLERRRFTAVIDHHGAGKPGWCQHRATYDCPISGQWKTWIDRDGKTMTQTDFAAFIEDNLPDIIEPSSSDILTISRTLEAKKKVDFQSGVRLDNGEVQLTYNEEIKGTAGKGSLDIPETFKLGIPVFEGGERYELEARLRYRLNEGRLAMWFDLLRPARLLEDAFSQTLEKVQTELEGLMVLHAEAP